MLTVFHDGFAPTQQVVDGVVEVEFPTANWSLAPSSPATVHDTGREQASPAAARAPR
jgi:hypothetical protein